MKRLISFPHFTAQRLKKRFYSPPPGEALTGWLDESIQFIVLYKKRLLVQAMIKRDFCGVPPQS
ncbi:MAG: hypothetical protein IJ861_03815 [Clostridia bacterium]|nr:hypothetical protein [Clostridia bacterium]